MKYKIWDDYEKTYVWDYATNDHMVFKTETAADYYIQNELYNYYVDKPIDVFQVKEIQTA